MIEIFQCKKCGTCCRNMFDDYEGVKKGLVLTAKEVNLFPSDMISPNLAIGTEKRKRIITYQLNVGSCPHIDINKCSIYDHRPLICRAFPFRFGNFSTKCPVFSYRTIGVRYCDFVPSKLQEDATEKMDRYVSNRLKKYYVKGSKIWSYDLATNKWVTKSETSTNTDVNGKGGKS